MRPGACRILIVAGLILAAEAGVRLGAIDRFSMPPPSVMLGDLAQLLSDGKLWPAIGKTLRNVALACAGAIVCGIVAGAVIHRLKAVRYSLDPLFAAYYAIPVYAFYPLFIVIFGLGDVPQILIGFALEIVAVIVNTLNGLDRVPKVLLKAARMYRMGPVESALRVALPGALPNIFTGIKLAVAYSFIGVIGAELIMSRTGLGYEIGFAYNNFDNAIMYPLIILVLAIAATVNALFSRWERAIMTRRRR